MPVLAFLAALVSLAAPALAGLAFAASVAPVRPIRAQTVIGPNDVELAETEAPGGVDSVEDVVGLEARVTLYPGRPILAAQVGPPAVVQRNQLVRMTYLRGTLAIQADGRALDRAGVGERVRVMNLASKQIVTGAVAEDGTVEVGE